MSSAYPLAIHSLKQQVIATLSNKWDTLNEHSKYGEFQDLYSSCLDDLPTAVDFYFVKAAQMITEENKSRIYIDSIDDIDYDFSFNTLLQVLDLTIKLYDNRTLL